MAHRIRLIDIADRLNLTKVSVSKALRDHPDISRETRELVKVTAAEMGYSPNLVARSLSSSRSFTLGVIVPKVAHTFFASVLDAVQKEATRMGYGTILAVSDENAQLEAQHIDRLLSMRVDGLLISVTQEPPVLAVYERVREMGVPLVFFDRKIDGIGFSSVTVDDREGAFQATSWLIRQGHREIAHIAGAPSVEIGKQRRAGYVEALEAHGIPLREDWILEGGFDEQHGYRSILEILKRGAIPSAIFAVTHPVALGVRAALWEQHESLLEQIALVSFGDGSIHDFFFSPHTCVQQPTADMGRLAVRRLMREIQSETELAPESIVLPTRVVPATRRGDASAHLARATTFTL